MTSCDVLLCKCNKSFVIEWNSQLAAIWVVNLEGLIFVVWEAKMILWVFIFVTQLPTLIT